MAAQPPGFDDFSGYGLAAEGRPSDFDNSLGIIPVENMSDLSDSIFRLGSATGSELKMATDKPAKSLSSLRSTGGLGDVLPSKANVSLDSSSSETKSQTDELPFEQTANKKQTDYLFQTANGFGTPEELPMEKPVSRKANTAPEVGMLFGAFAGVAEDEAEASFHEICFEADELEQFDEEFSDLGESDHTVTEDAPDGDLELFDGTRLDDISMPVLADGSGLDFMASNYSDLGGRESDGIFNLKDLKSKVMNMQRQSKEDAFEAEGHQIGEGQEDDMEATTPTLVGEESLGSGLLDTQFFRFGAGQEGRTSSSQRGDGAEMNKDVGPATMGATAQGPKGDSPGFGFEMNRDSTGDVAQTSNIFGDTHIASDDVQMTSNIFGDTQGAGDDFQRPSDIFGGILASNPDVSFSGTQRPSDIFGNMQAPGDDVFGKSSNNLALSAELPQCPPSPPSEGPVPDLAYKMSLDAADDMMAADDMDQQFEDDVFKAGGDMLDQFEKDEEEFEQENLFRQDDVMVTPDLTLDTPQDSWAYRSALLVRLPGSAEMDKSYCASRVSIGTFMGHRTEVLGSLAGDDNTPRPTFGAQFTTPPGNRKPVPLYDESPPACPLIGSLESKQTPSQPIRSEVRGHGVGSDVDAEGFDPGDGSEEDASPRRHDCTLTTDDLVAPSPALAKHKHSGKHANKINKMDLIREESPLPDQSTGGNIKVTVDKVPDVVKEKTTKKHSLLGPKVLLDNSDLTRRTPSPGLETSDINISTITRLVTGDNVGEDCVGAILKLSQAKALNKHHSRERRKAAVEATRVSSDSSDVEDHQRGKPRTSGPRTSSGEESSRAGSLEGRKPADGRATRQRDVSRLSKGSTIPAKGQSGKGLDDSQQLQKKVSKGGNESKNSGIPHRPGNSTTGRLSTPRKASIGSDTSETRKASIGSSRRGSNGSIASSVDQRRGSNSSTGSTDRRRGSSSFDQRRGSAGSMKSGTGSKIPLRRKSSMEDQVAKDLVPHATGKSAKENVEGSESIQSDVSTKESTLKADTTKVPDNSKMEQKEDSHEEENKSLTKHFEDAGDVLSKEAIAQIHMMKRMKKKQDDDIFKIPGEPAPIVKKSPVLEEVKNKSPTIEVNKKVAPEPQPKWKSPRPSSVLTRSQRQSSDEDSKHQTIPVWPLPETTPIKKGTTAPRRVQFQSDEDLPKNGSDSNRCCTPVDFCTPEDEMQIKMKPKWLSSTPKAAQHAFEDHQSLSHIITTPRESFNFGDPSLWAASQDERKKAATPDITSTFKPAISKADPLLQSQFASSVDTTVKPGLLTNHSLTTTGFASQHLGSSTNTTTRQPTSDGDSTLKRSTGRGFAINGVPQTCQETCTKPRTISKVKAADLYDVLPFLTTIPEDHNVTITAPADHIEFSPAADKTAHTEFCPFPPHLQEVRESLPGPPSIHSTPMMTTKTAATSKAWGYNEKQLTVDVPRDMRIPGVCCIGLSAQGMIPVHNPHQTWLNVSLQMAALSVNGDDQPLGGAVPFVFKDKLTLEPGKTEEVKVVFVPREPGAYVTQLHLVATPVVSDHVVQPTNQLPAIITIQGISEKPHIQILTCGSQLMDFGPLPYGCQKGLPITLINKGRASVPVRMVIASAGSHYRGFSFEKQPSPDISVISQQTRPPLPCLAPTITNHLLPGRDADDTTDLRPVQAVVYYKAPPRGHTDPATLPQEYCGRVSVEVDTPSKLVVIAQVDMVATVGVARLHTPTDMELLTLRTLPGQSSSVTLPLRNAGNIPLEVSLEVSLYPDMFTVTPQQTMIEPGGQSHVTLTFEPKHANVHKFDSMLLMFVEPDGPSYEISLLGEVVSPPPPAIVYPQTPRAPQLLSNKHYLAWGGVAVGKSKQQRLTLKNSANEMIKLVLQIRGNTSDFQLQSSFGQKWRLSSSKEIVLRPREEYPVHVLYSPSAVCTGHAKLQIKQTNLPMKYTIPLTGYGGTAELQLDDVKPNADRTSSWTHLGPLTAGHSVAASVTVCNRGDRPAYVKAMAFQDLSCKRKLRSGRLTVHPAEFCVRARSSAGVTVVMATTDTEAALCVDAAAIVGTVAFFYGDEAMRQLHTIASRKSRSKVTLADDNPLKGVNFDVAYQDQEGILEGFDMKPSPADSDLFYEGVLRTTLALVGAPPSPAPVVTTPVPAVSVVPIATTAWPLSAKCVPMDTPVVAMRPAVVSPPVSGPHKAGLGQDRAVWEDVDQLKPSTKPTVPVSPPVRDTDRHDTTSRCDLDEIEWWTVRPKDITVYAPQKENAAVIEKVQITNYTDKPMRFELYWPGHCVTVTPEEGEIAPRNFVLVCVSASPHLGVKDVKLPWSGKIHITCNQETKALKVQLKSDSECHNSSGTRPRPSVSSRSPGGAAQPLGTNQSVGTTQSVVTQTRDVRLSGGLGKPHRELHAISQAQIEFAPTVMKSETVQTVEIQNIQPFSIKWNITSFTPPYMKALAGSGGADISRVSYAVFWLPRQSGHLDPHQRIQIPIHFHPRDKGHFSQFLEVKSEVKGQTTSDLALEESFMCKLELRGMGVADPLGERPSLSKPAPALSVANVSSTAPLPEVTSRDQLLIVRPDRLQFTVSSPGGATEKVQIRNRSQDTEEIDILPVKEPFRVKFNKLSVKKHHYVRLPIDYRPSTPGYHQGELVLRRQNGERLVVKLQATFQ